jgi:hypothetical protein
MYIVENFKFCHTCLVGWGDLNDDTCWNCGEKENVEKTFYNGQNELAISCPAMKKHLKAT